jgi:thymidylate synthase
MNTIDKKYQDLLQDILDNGVVKKDRTGTGTISVFGRQIRHKMSQGFPLLTTKKMAWKTMVVELLWFLRGDTNIKFLLDYDCHIWDGDAYKNYTKEVNEIIDGYKCGDIMGMQPHIEKLFSDSDMLTPLTKEEFINKIKTDNEFGEEWGELGPIYGAQWREWHTKTLVKTTLKDPLTGNDTYLESDKIIDQIENLINDIKTNSDSRRLMVSAWNVGDLEYMVLPPCHYGFQMYTRELSSEERWELLNKKVGDDKFQSMVDDIVPFGGGLSEELESYNIPRRAISLMWNQRSVDTFLGLPFNIASYGLLLEIIAKEVNMMPDELIGNLGDVHLYSNHIEQAKEQINREPYDLPTVQITERSWYMHEKVKEHLGEKTFSEKILSYRPDCFELINYKSHLKIKAPLSN